MPAKLIIFVRTDPAHARIAHAGIELVPRQRLQFGFVGRERLHGNDEYGRPARATPGSEIDPCQIAVGDPDETVLPVGLGAAIVLAAV